MTTAVDVAAEIERTPAVLRLLLQPVPDEVLRARPEEDEWCVLEVIGHLIACDSGAFRDRITAILDGAGAVPDFHPWDAINKRDFATETLDALIEELAVERSKSAELLRSLDETALDATAPYRDFGEFAARDFVHEWPFHDENHLQQILDILQASHLPHMTSTMRNALADS